MGTKRIEYYPQGVCSKMMIVDINNGVIENAQVIGGCHGNSQGICALLKGMKAEDTINRLSGIKCGNKNTSCPDQMARALREGME